LHRKYFNFFAGPKNFAHVARVAMRKPMTDLDKSHFTKQNLSTFREERDRMLIRTLNVLTGLRLGCVTLKMTFGYLGEKLSWKC